MRAKRKKINFTPNVNNRKRGISIKGLPFVLTYCPKLKSLNNLFTKHLYLVYVSKEVKKLFTTKPMISFHSARKLINYLVRAKMNPIERNVESKNWGSKPCEVCINDNETFTGTVREETFLINQNFGWNAKCLVCLLTCPKCKIQYACQTVDLFCSRWNNYKSAEKKCRGGSYVQRHLFNHFCTSRHAGILDEVSITTTDKTGP